MFEKEYEVTSDIDKKMIDNVIMDTQEAVRRFWESVFIIFEGLIASVNNNLND